MRSATCITRTVTVIIVFVLDVSAHAPDRTSDMPNSMDRTSDMQNSMDKLVDKLAGKFFNRLLKASVLRSTGKPQQFVRPPGGAVAGYRQRFRRDVKVSGFSFLQELPKELLVSYQSAALGFPVLTKAMTSGICYSIGDLCAQAIAGKNLSTVDLGRTVRSGAAGFIGHGPLAHYWLDFLATRLSFGGAWWAYFPKIFVDQTLGALVYNTIYSLLIGCFSLRDPREVLRDVRRALVPAMIASIRFWPFIHVATFCVIPFEFQVLWIDVAEILWVCILSAINNEGLKAEDGTSKEEEEVEKEDENLRYTAYKSRIETDRLWGESLDPESPFMPKFNPG